MERQIDLDIENLKEQLFSMAGTVEEMLELATRGLFERQVSCAERAIELDHLVNQAERDIDRLCMKTLALHEPKARDLRFVISVTKMVTDLERIGDCSVNMARSVVSLIAQPVIQPYVNLPKMANTVRKMLKMALNAFSERDGAKAKQVCRMDDEVDNYDRKIYAGFTALMKSNPATIERALDIQQITRNLERIADHATNIAEGVIYFLDAEDIRHGRGF